MHKSFLIIGTISLLFIGCKKPPTVQNLQVESANVYPTTIDQLTSILDDGYSNIRSLDLYGWTALPGGFACSEHAADETGYMNLVDNNEASSNNPRPGSLWITNMWAGYYAGVRDANSTLDAANFYATNFAVAGDSASLKAIRGQAYFLRAWYYMQLECFYGEKYIDIKQPVSTDASILGVPLYTAVPTTLAQTEQPRATARQVWNQITSDLNTAIKLLPASWSGNFIGRVTSTSAAGLLGKAYVYTQNWDSAATVLGQVIATGTGPRGLPLQLMPFNIYKQAFNSNAFPGSLNSNTDQKFNQESLFEIEVDRVVGNGGYGIFGATPNLYLTTSQGLFWAPSGFASTGNPGSREGMGYGALFVHDKNLARFGFRVGSGYTLEDSLDINSLIPNQNYNPAALTHDSVSMTKVPGLWYTHISDSLRNSPNGADPRLYVCALEPYMDTVLFAGLNGGVDNSRLVRPVSKSVNIINNGDGYLGWSFKKYQTLDASMAEVEECDGANYYLLRLADIYLLYAEAAMHSSIPPSGTALTYINMVRRRAFNQPINSPSPYDYTSLTSTTQADPSDVNLINNPLAYERHAEFFGEGNWWFDECRWGNSNISSGANFNSSFGQNEANYYGILLPFFTPSQWTNASYCYPIPTAEIAANSLLSAQPNGGQNPGY
jgi:hypothetical protein